MGDGEEGEGCLRSQFSEWNRFCGSAEPSGWVEGKTQRDKHTKRETGNELRRTKTPPTPAEPNQHVSEDQEGRVSVRTAAETERSCGFFGGNFEGLATFTYSWYDIQHYRLIQGFLDCQRRLRRLNWAPVG